MLLFHYADLAFWQALECLPHEHAEPFISEHVMNATSLKRETARITVRQLVEVGMFKPSGGPLARASLRIGPSSSLPACVDVLDAVALVREGRAVGAREMLPAVILAGARVAG